MENKIKIEFESTKTITIKDKKYKGIEVMPYISSLVQTKMTDLCLKEHFDKKNEIDRFMLLPNIKMVFDMIILQELTNIDITDLDYYKVNESELMNIVRNNIWNYKEAFDIILKSIELRNVYDGFDIIAKNIPSSEQMDKNISDAGIMFEELSKSNPELLKEIANATIQNFIRENADAEFNESCVEEKKKTIEFNDHKKPKSKSKKKS